MRLKKTRSRGRGGRGRSLRLMLCSAPCTATPNDTHSKTHPMTLTPKHPMILTAPKTENTQYRVKTFQGHQCFRCELPRLQVSRWDLPETDLRRAHHFDFNYIGCTYDFSPFSNVRLFFWLRETDPRQAHHSGWQSHHMQRLSDITNTDIEISHEETHHRHWHRDISRRNTSPTLTSHTDINLRLLNWQIQIPKDENKSQLSRAIY